MSELEVDVLIVGGGPAGAACAETLASAGFDGSILLAGREADPPYERPYGSKEYLRGTLAREETYLRPAGWWEEHGVELRTRTSVLKLDPAARLASLSGGTSVRFGQALLATGANVRRLRVPGAELEGIHYLRALGNADTIRQAVATSDRVVLIGGSYIACEVATSLAAMGKHCTMVMQEALPLSRGFGDTAGRFFSDLLEKRGIDWVGNDGLAGFKGTDGRVSAVVTDSGRSLDADVVVMGTGAVPDVMLARSAGLELGPTGGIACSARLETSAPGLFAAGDACEHPSSIDGSPLRIEHWEVARAQGRAVAAAMMGEPGDYDELPYFWSDLAECCTLEYIGLGRPWNREVVRGPAGGGELCIFYLDADRVVGALTVGRPQDLDHARRLIRERERIEDPAYHQKEEPWTV